MINLKTYNMHINASYDGVGAFENWKNYRDALADLYNGEYWPMASGKVAIIGAGNLNDIDLSNFDKNVAITLVDCDLKAMVEGVKRQGGRENFTTHVLDLTGLDSQKFFEEISVLMSYKDINGILRYLKNVKIEPDLKLPPESFDLLIVTPIYTQLLLSQFVDLIGLTELSAHFETLVSGLMDFLVLLIDAINVALLNVLKVGGICVAWSDLMEYATDQPEYLSLVHEISHTVDEQVLETHINKYEAEYGKGIGVYGLENLCAYASPKLSADSMKSKYLIWPFDENRHLIVKAVRIQKNSI